MLISFKNFFPIKGNVCIKFTKSTYMNSNESLKWSNADAVKGTEGRTDFKALSINVHFSVVIG